MRRTKIVATLGPASKDAKVVRSLIDAGVDVFRVNFAHDTVEAHQATIATVREQAAEIDKVVGVLVDLPGPKMRTGPIASGEVYLPLDSRLVLTAEDVEGDESCVSTSVNDLAHMVSKDDEIYLADGEIVLRVSSVQGADVATEVSRPGILRSRKGMHLPGSEAHVGAFTPEDEIATKAAVEMGADLVGLSFVKDAQDIQRLRAALGEHGPKPLIVAKVETASAVANLQQIVPETDLVMVARGDLGIQTPL